MANILAASPVARTVSLARANVSSLSPDANFSSLLPSLKNIQEKNDFQDKLISQDQIQLNTISNKLTVFSIQLNEINSSLERISNLIFQDSYLETLQQREKEKRDFLLAQNEIRTERENLVERKIESALIKPVEVIRNKVQSAFSKVSAFFSTLFLGWLTNQGIAAFKANAEGAKDKLEVIKNNVINALGSVYKIIRLFYGGIQIIVSTVTSITGKITKFLLMDVIGGLFKKLGDIGKAVLQGTQNLLPKPPPPAPEPPPASTAGAGTKAASETAQTASTKAAQETAETAGKATTKAASEVAERRGGNLIGRLIPGLSTVANLGFAAYRFNAGDPLGGFLSLGQAVPGPIGAFSLGADVARDFGLWGNKPSTSASAQTPPQNQTAQQPSTQPQNQINKPQPAKTEPKPMVQPIQPVIPKPQPSTTPNTTAPNQSNKETIKFNDTLNLNTFGSTVSSENTNDKSGMDFSKPPTYGTVTGNVEHISNKESYSKTQVPSISLNVEKLKPNQSQKVGPVPEPKPKVIVAPLPPQQQPKSSSIPSTTGTAARVPVIPSSNTDNFYSLYSQVTYGVVI